MGGVEQRLAEIRRRVARLDEQISEDAGAFGRAIEEIVRLKTEEEALLIVKKCVIDFFTQVVTRTPVDTGRARVSWQFGVDAEPEGEEPEGDYRTKLAAHIAAASAKISASKAAVWWIANHLEYIEYLEAGWSDQAPAGMVALSLAELTRHLNTAVGDL